ncbi:hypothetical protein [Rhizosphaericola mali]|uniref:Prolyl oligopeptidase family serine peptidase n=1 Tax=Rhizosphaericola mali TaxID=2545455 RepID=A0A5P2FZG1_9BACT|nr:hypothetical protein [Rhizosphaericola mali]QES88327.1 hypothetical protein E0W69_006505 [Rhizosphaericola mali]
MEITFGDPNEWQKNYIIEILERNKVEKPFLIDCGTEDMVYPFSINLKSLCESLKIPITFISQPGNHDENYWKNSIEQHFLYFKRQLINLTVI